MQTQAYWISLSGETVEKIRNQGLWANDKMIMDLNGKVTEKIRQRENYAAEIAVLQEIGKSIYNSFSSF
jgi:hypothetical protein